MTTNQEMEKMKAVVCAKYCNYRMIKFLKGQQLEILQK